MHNYAMPMVRSESDYFLSLSGLTHQLMLMVHQQWLCAVP